MKFGVADYGMTVWEGGLFDLEERLRRLKAIGYDGLERLRANTEADAVHKAALFRRLGMDFATVAAPEPGASIEWTAAFGKSYVWTMVTGKDFDTFCRQVNLQVEACQRWGVRVALHNHLGTLVETPPQLEAFMARCPGCGLLLDTAHLAAAGGDPIAIVRRYPDRLASVHLKDWITTNPDVGLDKWTQRGRFCELGAGNIGLDNAAVMHALREVGYDGWILIEQDTHLQDPFKDLAISRKYLRQAGV
jgi:sugar phosphate isomerase/epimerase